MRANAANRLIQHYVDNFRRLPWRSAPGAAAPDPYRVWLSEIMLQQTTVAAVAPRFERFVRRWPTIEALAAARDEDILSEWAGLGYYARARNLIACARQVAADGGFATTEAELRALPGVGEYTAAAIAAIAFGRSAAVIDTNVVRVISRLNGLGRPTAQQVRALVQAMTPAERAGDFAQAMMDLGATICRPKAPDCAACPLASGCVARHSGTPTAYPAPKQRKVRPRRRGVAHWIERSGCVWLVRRPSTGLLGGMAALPGEEWHEAPSSLSVKPIGQVRHVFTHFALDLDIIALDEPTGDGWWQPIESLASAGLPTLYRRAVEAVMRQRDQSLAA